MSIKSELEQAETIREFTYGEKAMDIAYDPSSDSKDDNIKRLCAKIADILNKQRHETTSFEVKRMCSVAMKALLEARLWAVKSVTWEDMYKEALKSLDKGQAID